METAVIPCSNDKSGRVLDPTKRFHGASKVRDCVGQYKEPGGPVNGIKIDSLQ